MFCELVTLRAGDAGKSFKNLGLVTLPSFTDPPNRLFGRTVDYFRALAGFPSRPDAWGDRWLRTIAGALSGTDWNEFWIILVKRAEARCRIDE